jgi:hypothetical protein
VTVRFSFYLRVAVALIVLLGAAVALFEWRRSATQFDEKGLLSSLPRDRAVKVYLDADALRAGGLLDSIAGSQASEEPDYRHFIEQTGFDYRRDLNAAAASFVNGDVYIAARGHFDWTRLAEYARSQHGECSGSFCSMPASQPKRYISFHPLRDNVLALAVTGEQRGAAGIAGPGPQRADATDPVPSSPVWISAPGTAFRDLSGLPDGSHILSPLADAEEVSFSLGASKIQLDAICSSPEVAASVVVKFTATTNLLRSMLQRDKLTPSPADLSGVLVAGRFETRASHAIGTWPIQKPFIDSLLRGAAR